ncbi:MAG: hypothetical protein V1871_09060 [Planctomycetota bacterium]
MNDHDVKNLQDILNLMANLESVIAELYKTCGSIWKNNEGFWNTLSSQETKHAANIQKMSELIAKKPDIFFVARPFNQFATKSVINQVKGYIDKVYKGLTNETAMLTIARDLENSLLEAKYSEIVKTTDMEYNTMLSEVVNQTQEHRQLLNNRLHN